MIPEENKPRPPEEPTRDPIILKIIHWLSEDTTRTLPPLGDDAGIGELAQILGKSLEDTRALIAKLYAESDSDTLRF